MVAPVLGATIAMKGASMVKDMLDGDEPEKPTDDTAPAVEQPEPGEPASAPYPPMSYPPVAYPPMMPQQMMPGYAMPMYAAPAMATAPVAPGVERVPAAAPKTVAQRFAGTDDGRMKSLLKTAGAALVGGVGAAKIASADGATGGSLAAKVLAGAGAGAFSKMSYENIAAEGDGVKAGLTGAAAASLASTIKSGGPGAITSAAYGFGGGAVSNMLHDKLEAEGEGGKADLISGGLGGGVLGYALGGDMKTAGIFGAGGAGTSGVLGAADRAGGLGELVGEVRKMGLGSMADTQTPAADGPELG